MSNDNHPIGEVSLTNDEYHAAPGFSCSHIKTFAGGELDYVDKYIDPPKPLREEEPPTIAELWAANVDLDIGSAIHTAVLEPDLMDQSIIVMPDLNLRTKDGRAERDALLEQHYPAKLVLRPEDFELVKRCRDAVHTHPFASTLFQDGQAEQSFFAIDPRTGALVKCRTDWLNPKINAVVDVKSCRDASKSGFAKDATNLRYHFQPPWYLDVLETHFGEAPDFWVWLAIEKGPKPRIGVYFQQPEDISIDRDEVRRHFDDILERQATGKWAVSYTDHEAVPLERPGWARRRA